MQLMLAQKCAECRPDAFQMQVPTATGGIARCWAVALLGITWWISPGPKGLMLQNIFGKAVATSTESGVLSRLFGRDGPRRKVGRVALPTF